MTNRTERLSEIRLQLDEMRRIMDNYPYDSKESVKAMLNFHNKFVPLDQCE